MSVQGLQNPLQRLSVLPTTVSWRGTWVNTETYFKNDVAVSAVDGNSYILTGTTSVNAGSSDPSASPDWSQFSSASASGLSVISTPVSLTIGQNPNDVAVVTSGSLGLDSSLATPGATYLITYHGRWFNPVLGGFAATDQLYLRFIPNGSGAVGAISSIVPGQVLINYYFSGSVVVTIPPLGDSIVGSMDVGLTTIATPVVLGDMVITYTRLSVSSPS